jgi:hypothetical protein
MFLKLLKRAPLVWTRKRSIIDRVHIELEGELQLPLQLVNQFYKKLKHFQIVGVVEGPLLLKENSSQSCLFTQSPISDFLANVECRKFEQ